jgi:hypothetical protein
VSLPVALEAGRAAAAGLGVGEAVSTVALGVDLPWGLAIELGFLLALVVFAPVTASFADLSLVVALAAPLTRAVALVVVFAATVAVFVAVPVTVTVVVALTVAVRLASAVASPAALAVGPIAPGRVELAGLGTVTAAWGVALA